MPKKKAKLKITRRDMKKDPLVTFSLKAADVARRNARIIAIVSAVVAVAVVVVALMVRDRGRAEAEAEVLLADANKELWRGNANQAVGRYGDLLDRYAGTKSGLKALLFNGDALLEAGRYDDAIKSYERFMQREKRDEMLRNSARRGIATALEDKGEFARAADVRETLCKYIEGDEAAQELMGAARCYRAAAMYGRAIELYEKVISQHPQFWGIEEAKVYLAEMRANLRLSSQGAH
ncbi:MAG: tetratricopeptide repeat protein [Candidatus Eisenbacteria bacterium]